MSQELALLSGSCKKCRHDHKQNPYLKHKSVCTAHFCHCDNFEPYDNFTHLHRETLDYYREVLNGLKNTTVKIEWLLTNIPASRDLDEWAFLRFFWHFCYSFTQGSVFDARMVLALGHPSPEAIRRAKQKICHNELELWQDYKLDLKNAKYLPSNDEILIARGIKRKSYHDYALLIDWLVRTPAVYPTLDAYMNPEALI